MSYSKRQANASRNIREVKGWVCPTCESLVPRGYEVCYNCGDMPPLYSSSSANLSSSDAESEVLGCLFYLGAVFIAPFLYAWISSAVTRDGKMLLAVFLFIPTVIMLLPSGHALLKKRKRLGWFSIIVRLWVFIFSFLTLYHMVFAFFN